MGGAIVRFRLVSVHYACFGDLNPDVLQQVECQKLVEVVDFG